MERAWSRPSRWARLPKSTEVPLLTWPPLRPEAPLITRLASSTTTLAPRRARARAAERPVKPPPMTTASACAGRDPCSAPVKAGAVSCQ